MDSVYFMMKMPFLQHMDISDGTGFRMTAAATFVIRMYLDAPIISFKACLLGAGSFLDDFRRGIEPCALAGWLDTERMVVLMKPLTLNLITPLQKHLVSQQKH